MSTRGCLILALLVLASELSAQTAAVEVQVYDQAGLQPSTFQNFVTQTQNILSETGLSIQVKTCGRSVSVVCETQSYGTRYLVIHIVAGHPKKMKNVRRPPLGQSFADENGGKYASLFLEHVQDEATSNNVPWVRVLSYAAVHEIGHLLLGNGAHTSRGVMKATWDRTDFEAMNQNYLNFSKEQMRQLQSRYGSAGSAVITPEALKLVEVKHAGSIAAE
jgi:hypothetical protein